MDGLVLIVAGVAVKTAADHLAARPGLCDGVGLGGDEVRAGHRRLACSFAIALACCVYMAALAAYLLRAAVASGDETGQIEGVLAAFALWFLAMSARRRWRRLKAGRGAA